MTPATPSALTAFPLPAYQYRVAVVRVIDGDTVEADVDLGFYVRVRTNLRLFGINAPEKNTPEGKEAANFLTATLAGAPAVTARVHTPDKYGNRWNADLYVRSFGPGESALWVNQLLVNAGHAAPVSYKGGDDPAPAPAS